MLLLRPLLLPLLLLVLLRLAAVLLLLLLLLLDLLDLLVLADWAVRAEARSIRISCTSS